MSVSCADRALGKGPCSVYPFSFHARRLIYIRLLPHRSGKREDHTASYFSHGNVEATKLRDELASDSLEMLIQWLKEGGNVGIHGMSCVRVFIGPSY